MQQPPRVTTHDGHDGVVHRLLGQGAGARPRILEGNVDELDLTTLGAFDVVTAFDIVEHSLEPLKFLARLHDLLRVGGWLALTTPDAGHGLRYVMGKRWPMLQPLQHT